MQGGGRILRDKSDEKFTFSGNLNGGSFNFNFFCSKKAFSIAEAMITLLIVSMALAAMAPMVSKQVKGVNNSIDKDALKNEIIKELQKDLVPKGSVMFVSKIEEYKGNNACPQGWRNAGSAWDGRYPRMTTDFNAIGVLADESLPNITGWLHDWTNNFMVTHANGAYVVGASDQNERTADVQGSQDPYANNHGQISGILQFDASKSNPIYGRSGNEVLPKTVHLAACVKN